MTEPARHFRSTSKSLLRTFSRVLTRGAAGLAMIACGISMSACESERMSSTAPPNGSNEPIPFTFLAVVPPESMTFAPELLAQAAGYFGEEGLEVKMETTRGSAQAIQLILADRAPLSRVALIDGMRAVANRDAPLVNVGTVIKDTTIRYISSSKDPLLKLEDFVGKTVGIPSEGGSSDLELSVLLAASGIDPSRVSRQVVGLTPGVFDLVERARIAGYAVGIDTAKVLEHQQRGAVVLDPSGLIASGGQFYVTSRNGLARHGVVITKYLRAVRRAIEFILDDEGYDATLAILRSRYSFEALNDTAIAKESLGEHAAAWSSAGRESILRTDPSMWVRSYSELATIGLVETQGGAEAWFTNELVEAL